MINLLKDGWSDLHYLFYPSLCSACSKPLYDREGPICAVCLHKLPYTRFHVDKDNKVAKIFWGRCDLFSATAFLYFQKGNRTQRLLHRLKYRGDEAVGYELGKLMGDEFNKAELFALVDWIVPIPLHPDKLKARGYNQAERLAEGIGMSMSAEVKPELLRRVRQAISQTKRSRYDRYLNADAMYALDSQSSVLGKHILLVDDVVTTGATLEACANVLLEAGAVVSVAALAVAK